MIKAITSVYLVLLALPLTAQDAANCSTAEAKQFDFWVGEWFVEWKDQNGQIQKGSNRIEKIMNGCVIQENFITATLKGTSLSVYSPQLKKWRQTWVDNNGSYLDFIGEYKENKLVLARETVLADGRRGLQRMSFYNISRDRLDWDWETSEDGGKNWTLRWRIHYTRKK